MPAIDSSAWVRQIRPILGVLKTPVVHSILHEAPRPIVPFVTVSRQAGAGAWQLTQRLVERLNEVDRSEVPWTGWDRELIEKVAADHHLSHELIESLEERDHNWLSEFLAGLTITDTAPSEETVFRDVSTTLRALAQAGRVVVVGMGGVLTTRRMPGGIHVRLIAPRDYRIDALAQRTGMNRAQAEAEINRLEHNRNAFYTRHWPWLKIEAELFHLTLNVARLSEQQIVDCIVAMIPRGNSPQPGRLSELAGY